MRLFATDRHSDRCLLSPFGMYGILPIPWWIDLPQNRGHTCYLGGPSRPYILPPSALSQWHVRTFHVG